MKAGYFSKDVQDFLILLDRHMVRYVIVGGEAVIYYGYPRLTGDIDFLYDIKKDNVSALFQVLLAFWDQDIPGIRNEKELMEKGAIFQFGLPPNRLDLINDIDGLTFEEAWDSRLTVRLRISDEEIEIHYIGRQELIKNKKASDRPKDRDDLRFLTGETPDIT